MTTGGLIVAIGGLSLSAGSELTIQSMGSGVAGALGAAAFLAAFRGSTRQVERELLDRELTDADFERAWSHLRWKKAWSWLAARLLLAAVVTLGVVSGVNAAG
jgi:hypothetical protein